MDTTADQLLTLAEACLQHHELSSEPSFAVAFTQTPIASFRSWPHGGVPPEDLAEVSSARRPLPPAEELDFAFPVLPILEPDSERWQTTTQEPSTFSFPDEHVADSCWETLQHPCKLRPVHCAH